MECIEALRDEFFTMQTKDQHFSSLVYNDQYQYCEEY